MGRQGPGRPRATQQCELILMIFLYVGKEASVWEAPAHFGILQLSTGNDSLFLLLTKSVTLKYIMKGFLLSVNLLLSDGSDPIFKTLSSLRENKRIF